MPRPTSWWLTLSPRSATARAAGAPGHRLASVPCLLALVAMFAGCADRSLPIISDNVVDGNAPVTGPVTNLMGWENVGPTLFDIVAPDLPPYIEGTDYRVTPGSGSGDITARLVAIDVAIPPTAERNNDPNPEDTSTRPLKMLVAIR